MCTARRAKKLAMKPDSSQHDASSFENSPILENERKHDGCESEKQPPLFDMPAKVRELFPKHKRMIIKDYAKIRRKLVRLATEGMILCFFHS